MSEHQPRRSLEDLGNPICEVCGTEVDERGRTCPAREDGMECAP